MTQTTRIVQKIGQSVKVLSLPVYQKPLQLTSLFFNATQAPHPVVSQPPIRIDYSDPIYIDTWDYRDPSNEMGQK